MMFPRIGNRTNKQNKDFSIDSGKKCHNEISQIKNIQLCSSNLLNKELTSAISTNDNKQLKQLLSNKLNIHDNTESGLQADLLSLKKDSMICLLVLLDSDVPLNVQQPPSQLTALRHVSHLMQT